MSGRLQRANCDTPRLPLIRCIASLGCIHSHFQSPWPNPIVPAQQQSCRRPTDETTRNNQALGKVIVKDHSSDANSAGYAVNDVSKGFGVERIQTKLLPTYDEHCQKSPWNPRKQKIPTGWPDATWILLAHCSLTTE